MANYFQKKYEGQENYFDKKYGAPSEEPDPTVAPVAEPRETTWGEFAGGALTDLGIGTMRATKSIPDTLSFVLPDKWTDPWSEFFERGIESAEWLKPEAYKAQAALTYQEKDAFGRPTGNWQMPSAEAVLGTGIQSLPMIPFFMGGAGATKAAATAGKSLIAAKTGKIATEAGKGAELAGFGMTNAAMVAPDQWRQTYHEALETDPVLAEKDFKGEEITDADRAAAEQRARDRADWAAGQTAMLSGGTGLLGGAAAQKLGIDAKSLTAAIIKGFMGEAPFEGVEESGQSIISDLALGRPVDIGRAIDVGGMGATAGGLPGAGFGGMSYIGDQNNKSLYDVAREVIDAESRQDGLEPIDLDALEEQRQANELRPVPGVTTIVEEVAPTMTGESEVAKAMKLAARIQADQARQRIAERRKAEEPAPVREIEPVEQEEVPLQERTEPLSPEPEPTPEEINYQAVKEVSESDPVPVPKKPPTLLDKLAAKNIRLDRRKFKGDLQTGGKNVRVGNRWLFEGEKSEYQDQGLGPDALVEFMVEEGYLPEPDPNGPTQYGINEALDILNQAILDPDSVISTKDGEAWAEYDNAVQYNQEIDRAGFELEQLDKERIEEANEREAFDALRFGEESDPAITDEEFETLLEQRWQEYEQTQQEAQYADEGTVQESSEGGTLIPEATPQETAAAAVEAKTEERNQLGKDEVPVEQGEGELFAGNTPGVRPEQTDILEQPNETETEVQKPDESSDPAIVAVREARKLIQEAEQGDASDRYSESNGKLYTERWSGKHESGIEVQVIEYEGGKRRVTFYEHGKRISRAKAEELLVGKKPTLSDKAEAAKARLKAKRHGTSPSGVDPQDFADLALIGADYVNQGVKTFAEFSKKMVAEFGDWVKPALKDVWAKVAPPEAKPRGEKKPTKTTTSGEKWGKAGEERQKVAEESESKPKPKRKTSNKNKVTREERDARNADQIFFEFRESNEELVERAEQALKDNPNVASEIIHRLNTEADPSISRLDLAILMVHKTDVRMEARRQAKRMLDPKLDASQRATATAKYEDAMLVNDEIDLASLVAGAVWGGWGQLRSKYMREDYSLESQLAVTSALLGKPPTEEQAKFIEKLVDRVADLEEKLAENERNKEHEITQEVLRRVARQMNRDARGPKKTVNKYLGDTRRSLSDELRSDLLRLNDITAIPELFYKLAKLGAVIMAQGAVEFGTWANELRKSLGKRAYKKIEGDIDAIYAAAQDQYHEIETESTADGSGEFRLQSPRGKKQELLYEAEALSEVDEALTHKLVYELAKLYIQAGITEENEVMAAVTADLKAFYPDITEKQVRVLFTEYGQAKFPSQEQDKKRLRELRTLVRLQLSIDRALKGKSPLRTGPQRDKATQKVREKQRLLNEAMRKLEQIAPTPNRRNLASVNEQRVRRLENQIKDLEKEIATGEKQNKRSEPLPDSPEVKKLKKKRDALKKRLAEIEAAKKPQLTEDEKYNEMRRKQLQRQLKEVSDRLRNKDYAPRKRKVMPELDKKNRDLKDELQKAKMELGEKQLAWKRSNYTWRQKVWDGFKQFTSLVRAVKTSYDLSAVLRQGGFYVLSHPFVAIKSFVPMIKALGGDKFAREVNDEILSRPNAHLYRKAGLFLAEQDSAHPTKMEEVYMSRWQSKVPGVAASGRAYVTFLNKLRADVFDATYDGLTNNGNRPLTEEELLDLGDFINNATGRADLGRFNSEGISTVFFAPRWVMSRFNMMAYPLRAAGIFSGRSGKAMSNRLKLRVAREYMQFGLGFSILWMLTAMLFGDDDDDHPVVEWNPISSNFGKVRVGDTRLDVTSGMSNAITFVARSLRGKTMSQSGEIRDLRVLQDNIPFGYGTYGDVLARFFRSKLAPVPSSIWNVMEGQNVVGENYAEGVKIMEELGIPSEIAESRLGNAVQEFLGYGVPLSVADFYDAAEAHGIPKAAALQFLATLGISMNTYSDKTKKEAPKKKGRLERPKRPKRPKRPSRPERG